MENPKNTPVATGTEFSPLFTKNFANEDPIFKQSPERQLKMNRFDTSSCIVMEDDYKAIKLENNLEHLNKDIE